MMEVNGGLFGLWYVSIAQSSRFGGRTSLVRQGPSRRGNQSRSDSSDYAECPFVTRSKESSPKALLDAHHYVNR